MEKDKFEMAGHLNQKISNLKEDIRHMEAAIKASCSLKIQVAYTPGSCKQARTFTIGNKDLIKQLLEKELKCAERMLEVHEEEFENL
jgi:hypothetical protein